MHGIISTAAVAFEIN